MSRGRPFLFSLVAACLAVAIIWHFDQASPPPPEARAALAELVRTPDDWRARTGRVTHVTDGDTFRLDGRTAIRLVGVDTPEVRHGRGRDDPGGVEATDWARRELLGREVVCYVHPGNARDRFGRVPALVFLRDGRCINMELLRAGHARARYLHFSPDVRADRFHAAERRPLTPPRGSSPSP